MAAARAAIQAKTHHRAVSLSDHTVEFSSKEDPYKDLTASFPAEQDRILDVKLEKLMLDGAWQGRRLIASKERIVFGKIVDADLTGRVTDAIPLFEVIEIEYVQNGAESGSPDDLSIKAESDKRISLARVGSCMTDSKKVRLRNGFRIRTAINGYNSGRTYYLKVSNENQCEEIVQKLSESARQARQVMEAKTRFEKSQERVRRIYHSVVCQTIVALMIIANFLVNAVATQFNDVLNSSTSHLGAHNTTEGAVAVATYVEQLSMTLDAIDVTFTALFSAELCVNLYAHWLRAFWRDGWNVFDFVIIALSLVALGPVDMPISVIRLMRTFRVIRLFGRMKALRQIIFALTASLVPVTNAFFILLIVIAIYAILGVNYFAAAAPDGFLKFDRAFVSMFRVAAGETWIDQIPVVDGDGELNFPLALFLFSFILIVNWTLLQVSVAVLLDNFVSASGKIEEEERQRQKMRANDNKTVSLTLDPLLARISRDFVDNADLSSTLLALFRVLDSDESGSLTFQELCTQIKKLDIYPPIYLTDSDFSAITQDGKLCDSKGNLHPLQFEAAFRSLLLRYAQRRLADCASGAASGSEVVSAQLGALKILLLRIEQTEEMQLEICQPNSSRNNQTVHNACFDGTFKEESAGTIDTESCPIEISDTVCESRADEVLEYSAGQGVTATRGHGASAVPRSSSQSKTASQSEQCSYEMNRHLAAIERIVQEVLSEQRCARAAQEATAAAAADSAAASSATAAAVEKLIKTLACEHRDILYSCPNAVDKSFAVDQRKDMDPQKQKVFMQDMLLQNRLPKRIHIKSAVFSKAARILRTADLKLNSVLEKKAEGTPGDGKFDMSVSCQKIESMHIRKNEPDEWLNLKQETRVADLQLTVKNSESKSDVQELSVEQQIAIPEDPALREGTALSHDCVAVAKSPMTDTKTICKRSLKINGMVKRGAITTVTEKGTTYCTDIALRKASAFSGWHNHSLPCEASFHSRDLLPSDASRSTITAITESRKSRLSLLVGRRGSICARSGRLNDHATENAPPYQVNMDQEACGCERDSAVAACTSYHEHTPSS